MKVHAQMGGGYTDEGACSNGGGGYTDEGTWSNVISVTSGGCPVSRGQDYNYIKKTKNSTRNKSQTHTKLLFTFSYLGNVTVNVTDTAVVKATLPFVSNTTIVTL